MGLPTASEAAEFTRLLLDSEREVLAERVGNMRALKVYRVLGDEEDEAEEEMTCP